MHELSITKAGCTTRATTDAEVQSLSEIDSQHVGTSQPMGYRTLW